MEMSHVPDVSASGLGWEGYMVGEVIICYTDRTFVMEHLVKLNIRELHTSENHYFSPGGRFITYLFLAIK